MPRLLALDIGEKRIGLAVTDEEQAISQPLEFTAEPSEITKVIKSMSEQYKFAKIIVGLPKSMSGEEGMQAKKVRKVADRIKKNTELPIEYFDERLTTKQALGLEGRNKNIPIDSLAAQQLLEQYLRANRNKQ